MKIQGRIEELDYGMTFAAEQVEFPRTIYDDMSGKPLDWNLVKQAREEEMAEVRKHKIYEKVPLTMCYEETGKNPIGVRWVDINKGDEVHVEYRSRLVAQELNKSTRGTMICLQPHRHLKPRNCCSRWQSLKDMDLKEGEESMDIKLTLLMLEEPISMQNLDVEYLLNFQMKTVSKVSVGCC